MYRILERITKKKNGCFLFHATTTNLKSINDFLYFHPAMRKDIVRKNKEVKNIDYHLWQRFKSGDSKAFFNHKIREKGLNSGVYILSAIGKEDCKELKIVVN